MKAIAVNGITKSGKTTVCEILISGLRQRGFSVGSVKEIHFEQFQIDPDSKTNTNRHKTAGAQLVTARGLFETDILYQSMLPINEILMHYDHDFVILEGVTDCNVPRILTAHSEQEIADAIDGRAVAVSGVFANDHQGEMMGLPIINPLTESDRLVDFVLEHAFEPLPSCDPECCSACGFDCRAFAGEVAHRRAPRSGCVLTSQDVELLIDGRAITMVPFVQNILKNAVMGVVSELDGHKENGRIEVRFRL